MNIRDSALESARPGINLRVECLLQTFFNQDMNTISGSIEQAVEEAGLFWDDWEESLGDLRFISERMTNQELANYLTDRGLSIGLSALRYTPSEFVDAIMHQLEARERMERQHGP